MATRHLFEQNHESPEGTIADETMSLAYGKIATPTLNITWAGLATWILAKLTGITTGKIPVIGVTWTNSRLVSTTSAGTVEASIPFNINTGSIPPVQSTLTPGQTVKVGSTGLVSSVDDHYGITAYTGIHQTITHNLDIPVVNQVLNVTREYLSGGFPATNGLIIFDIGVNSFSVRADDVISTGNYHWHIHDTR